MVFSMSNTKINCLLDLGLVQGWIRFLCHSLHESKSSEKNNLALHCDSFITTFLCANIFNKINIMFKIAIAIKIDYNSDHIDISKKCIAHFL